MYEHLHTCCDYNLCAMDNFILRSSVMHVYVCAHVLVILCQQKKKDESHLLKLPAHSLGNRTGGLHVPGE